MGRREALTWFDPGGGENGLNVKRLLDAATMNNRSRSCGKSVASLTFTVQHDSSLNQYPARRNARRTSSNQVPSAPYKRCGTFSKMINEGRSSGLYSSISLGISKNKAPRGSSNPRRFSPPEKNSGKGILPPAPEPELGRPPARTIFSRPS